ncbi:hypothetical protein SETIT_9G135500v2, partial [Setaria italica]
WWEAVSGMGCNCSFSSVNTSLQNWRVKLRRQQSRERRKGLDTLFMLTIWSIWEERNARLFNQSPSTLQELMQRIGSDTDLWVVAGARRLGCLKQE